MAKDEKNNTETKPVYIRRPPQTAEEEQARQAAREKEVFDVPALAAYLRVSVPTVRKWVSNRTIPFHKIGGLIRFEKTEIEDWFDSTKVDHISSNNVLSNKAVNVLHPK